jgi:two-component system sensor histidine kinase KdpD
VGKPRRLWTRILIGSIVDALVQGSGDIDVPVITAERERQGVPQAPGGRQTSVRLGALRLGDESAVALATGAAWLTLPFFELANQVMVYLLGIVVVATATGEAIADGPILSVPSSTSSSCRSSRLVTDVRYPSPSRDAGRRARHQQPAARIRLQAEAARQREQRTAAPTR